MIYIENIEDIKQAMNMPDDDKNIEPKDLMYQEDRLQMRFGGKE